MDVMDLQGTDMQMGGQTVGSQMGGMMGGSSGPHIERLDDED